MTWILTGLIMTVLTLITVEDFRHRAVSWPLFPALAILIMVYTYFKKDSPAFQSYVLHVFINAGFITVQLLLLKLYYLVKNRGNTALINNRIGIGDIFFLYSITFYFTPLLFILFYLFSLVMATTIVSAYMLINNHRREENTIPLAGIQALFLLIFMVTNFFIDFNAISEDWLLNHYPLA